MLITQLIRGKRYLIDKEKDVRFYKPALAFNLFYFVSEYDSSVIELTKADVRERVTKYKRI